jgi:hypothetical protein
MALAVGTPVLNSSNAEFGTVEHVLQIPAEDLFDGIAVKTKHGLRFVDRAVFPDRRGGREPPGSQGNPGPTP